MFDPADLAMGWLHARDRASELQRNPLMAQTDSQHRHAGVTDYFGGHPEIAGISRMAGARRNNDRIELPRVDLFPCPLVIAYHGRHFAGDGGGGVREVVRERIVVV